MKMLFKLWDFFCSCFCKKDFFDWFCCVLVCGSKGSLLEMEQVFLTGFVFFLLSLSIVVSVCVGSFSACGGVVFLLLLMVFVFVLSEWFFFDIDQGSLNGAILWGVFDTLTILCLVFSLLGLFVGTLSTTVLFEVFCGFWICSDLGGVFLFSYFCFFCLDLELKKEEK